MRGTHNNDRPVRLPRLDGMVPLSWLFWSCLRACVVALSVLVVCRAGTGTHSCCSRLPRLPRLDGKVPLRKLLLRYLRAGEEALSV
jgi:hypothetical protein